MRHPILLITMFLIMVGISLASEAPPEMKKFNVKCPAKELCPKLNLAYQGCMKRKGSPCLQFMEILKVLLPEYDCQRQFDHTPTNDYIVAAIWLCKPEGDVDNEEYFSLLSKLKYPQARELFASKEFRNALDGYIAEMYFEQSLELEKKLKSN